MEYAIVHGKLQVRLIVYYTLQTCFCPLDQNSPAMVSTQLSKSTGRKSDQNRTLDLGRVFGSCIEWLNFLPYAVNTKEL